jgi:hypothetical protein
VEGTSRELELRHRGTHKISAGIIKFAMHTDFSRSATRIGIGGGDWVARETLMLNFSRLFYMARMVSEPSPNRESVNFK